MPKDYSDLYPEMIRLRKTGMTISEIAEELKISRPAVANCVRDVPIPKEKYEATKEMLAHGVDSFTVASKRLMDEGIKVWEINSVKKELQHKENHLLFCWVEQSSEFGGHTLKRCLQQLPIRIISRNGVHVLWNGRPEFISWSEVVKSKRAFGSNYLSLPDDTHVPTV